MKIDEQTFSIFWVSCVVLGGSFMILSLLNLSEYGKKNFWYLPSIGLSELKKKLSPTGWLFYKIAAAFILVGFVTGFIWGITHPK